MRRMIHGRPRRTTFPEENNDHKSPERGSSLVFPETAKMTVQIEAKKRGRGREGKDPIIQCFGGYGNEVQFYCKDNGKSWENLTGVTKS